MSRVEFVLIGTEQAFDAVSARVAALLGVEAELTVEDTVFPLEDGGWVELDPDGFDPWTDERLQGFRWQLAVGGLDDRRQEAAARRVYELLAAGTTWALALTYDHADTVVAARTAVTPDRRRG